MSMIMRARFAVPLCLAFILLAGIPAFAQVDFTGVFIATDISWGEQLAALAGC